MATQTFHFDPAAGPISVVMSSGQANPGHYGLMLIGSNRIDIVKEFPTTEFGSTAQNTHQLPEPTGANDGRFLNVVASVGLLGAEKAFAVFMKVRQGGSDLGEVSQSGTGTGLTKVCELTAALSAAAAGLVADAGLGVASGARRAEAEAAPRLDARRNDVVARTKALRARAKKPATKKKGTAKKAAKRSKSRRRGGAR